MPSLYVYFRDAICYSPTKTSLYIICPKSYMYITHFGLTYTITSSTNTKMLAWGRHLFSRYTASKGTPPPFFSKGVTYNTKIPYNNKICVEKTKKYVTEYYFSGFISSGKQIVSKYGRFPLLLQNLKVGFIYVYRMVFRDYKFCNITGKSYVTGVLVYSYQ